MALSRVELVGNGTQTDFVVPFALGYFKPTDIICRVGQEIDGIPAPTRSIQIIAPTLIRVLGTPAQPGQPVLFERTITATSKLVNFTDGNIINEENLDTDTKQALYLVHQALDGRIRDIVYQLDMHKNRITNLGEPNLDTDAATKGYVQKFFDSIKQFLPVIHTNGTVTPQNFGAVGDGIADDTLALQAMIDSSFKVFDWGVDKVYRKTKELVFNNADQYHYGHNVTLLHDHSVAGYCRPNVVGKNGAQRNYFRGIIFDHNAVGVPQAFLDDGIALVLQCNVIWAGDGTTFERCTSVDAWDSGLAFQDFAYTGDGATFETRYTSTHSRFLPKRIHCIDCIDYRAGVGEHVAQPWWSTYGTFLNSKQGVGFNFLSASQSTMTDCIAIQSNTGFACDFAAGAVDNTLTGCIAVECKIDPNLPRVSAPGGWGFWIGEALNTLQGCMSVSCEGAGFVISPFASKCTLTGCIGYANNKQGIIIGATGTKLFGCQFFENSLEDLRLDTNAFYTGIELRIGTSSIKDIIFTGCASTGQYQTYGLDIVGNDGSGGVVVEAVWNFGLLEGTIAPWRIWSHAVTMITKSSTLTRNMQINGAGPVAESNLHIHGEVSDVTVNPLGGGANNGPLCVSSRLDPTKKISVGVDIGRDANGIGVMQALRRGVSVIPMEINPSGGNVKVGHNHWSTGHMQIGDYHLWVSSDGKLRIKNGAPTADADGTVVGTQT